MHFLSFDNDICNMIGSVFFGSFLDFADQSEWCLRPVLVLVHVFHHHCGHTLPAPISVYSSRITCCCSGGWSTPFQFGHAVAEDPKKNIILKFIIKYGPIKNEKIGGKKGFNIFILKDQGLKNWLTVKIWLKYQLINLFMI